MARIRYTPSRLLYHRKCPHGMVLLQQFWWYIMDQRTSSDTILHHYNIHYSQMGVISKLRWMQASIPMQYIISWKQYILPPLCVYFCCVLAMNLAIYSMEGASSQVKRKLWVSIRACDLTSYKWSNEGKLLYQYHGLLSQWFDNNFGKYPKLLKHVRSNIWRNITFSIKTLASAVKPANAIVKCSSNLAILRIVLDSCRDAVAFLSTPRMTQSPPRTPTTAEPLFTASMAYSTWKRWPSGEKTVIARS